MGTAQVQGSLWGARVRDYASFGETQFRPVYETVFGVAGVGVGTRLLDVGCGPGLATQIAAQRGARVAGLDAAEASLTIARERTPDGDFRVGDMEELPWPNDTFDVVTGFNSFFFAADVVNALREARRVAKPGGQVVMLVWGREEDCQTMATVSAVAKLLPPPPRSDAPPLSTAGRVESLMESAGLTPLTSDEVDCVFEFPNLETALRGLTSAGVMVAAAQRVGDDLVRQVVADTIAACRTDTGGYRQRNRYRYVVASA